MRRPKFEVCYRWFWIVWCAWFLAFDVVQNATWQAALQAFLLGFWLTITAVKRWPWFA